MGLLGDFAGAFATNIGNEMQQQEQINYQLQIQEALERRRRQYQQEDEARRRRTSNEDKATAMNLSGPSVDLDEQGRQSLMRVRAEVDPETGALRGTRERVGDAPVMPEGRPFTVYDGQNKRTVQRFSDGSERDLGDPSPVRAPSSGGSSKAPIGEDGLTPYQRENIKARKEREARLERQGGKGGERPDNVRENWTKTAKAIGEADGEVLRSIAAQFGMDQRGLPTDDESLKAALLARVDADFGKRLKAASTRGDKSESSDEAKAIAAARAAIDRGAPADAVLKRLREMYPGASL